MADVPLLSEMGYASYQHHFAHLWLNQDELQTFLCEEYAPSAIQQSLANETSAWFIADDGAPVGFAKVSWHCAIGENEPVGTLLHKLYLLPGETGKGYGARMLADIERRAHQRGERYLWLEVLDANPNARRFYLRLGFTPLQQRLFCTASQQSTLHILGKPL